MYLNKEELINSTMCIFHEIEIKSFQTESAVNGHSWKFFEVLFLQGSRIELSFILMLLSMTHVNVPILL